MVFSLENLVIRQAAWIKLAESLTWDCARWNASDKTLMCPIKKPLRQFLSFPIPALNRTMIKLAFMGKTLEDYNYDNEMIADIILNEIADVQFTGMSVSNLLFKFLPHWPFAIKQEFKNLAQKWLKVNLLSTIGHFGKQEANKSWKFIGSTHKQHIFFVSCDIFKHWKTLSAKLEIMLNWWRLTLWPIKESINHCKFSHIMKPCRFPYANISL